MLLVFKSFKELLNFVERLVIDMNSTYEKISSIGVFEYITRGIDNVYLYRKLSGTVGTNTTRKYFSIKPKNNDKYIVTIEDPLHTGRISLHFLIDKKRALNSFYHLHVADNELLKTFLDGASFNLEYELPYSLYDTVNYSILKGKQYITLNSENIVDSHIKFFIDNVEFHVTGEIKPKLSIYTVSSTDYRIIDEVISLDVNYELIIHKNIPTVKLLDSYPIYVNHQQYGYLIHEQSRWTVEDIKQVMDTILAIVKEINSKFDYNRHSYIKRFYINRDTTDCLYFSYVMRTNDNMVLTTPRFYISIVDESLYTLIFDNV